MKINHILSKILEFISLIKKITVLTANVTVLETNKFKKLAELNKKWEIEWGQLCHEILVNNQDKLLIKQEELQQLLNKIKDNILISHNESNVKDFLLPIFKLAHIYESNDILAEESAKKFDRIFSNAQDALTYLDLFAKNVIEIERQRANKDNRVPNQIPVVHDACLFTLPENETDFNFKTQKWQQLIKYNMQNPEFKKLLVFAPEIAKSINQLIAYKQSKHEKFNKIELTEQLKEAINEIRELNKKYKLIRDKLVNGKELTVDEENNRNKYGNNLLDIQFKVVDISAALGRFIEDLSIEELIAYKAKYKSEAEKEFRYFLDNYLTEQNYRVFKELKPVDDNSRIPRIMIGGEEVGFPGYYLRRLDVESSADAAMAACLGKLSNCCQSLSGEAGQPCAIHGLTSKEGGFYVVCKGNIQDYDIKDPLVCQSWVWRSQTDALVIDSVESDLKEINVINIARAFYYELAYRLIKDYQVPKICCGLPSGISKDLLQPEIKNPIPAGELPKDYMGYRDSDKQFMLCGINELYLLPGKEKDFFSNYNGFDSTHFLFIKMINFAIKNNMKNLLENYYSLFPDKGAVIVIKCQEYLNLIKEKQIELAIQKLTEMPYLAYIQEDDGMNILHIVASSKTPDLLKQVLKLYPEQDRLEALKEKNHYGNNALHIAAKSSPESLKQILEIYPKQGILEALKEKNNYGNNALHIAAKSHPESLKQILEIYPKQGRLEAVKEKDEKGNNLLHLAASSKKPDSLKQLLELFPEQDRLEAIKEKDENHYSVLRKAACNSELLKQLLELFPEQDRLEVVSKDVDKNGVSILFDAAVCLSPELSYELFKKILELLPEQDRLKAVTTKVMNNSSSILHEVARYNSGSLKQILELLPKQDRLDAVSLIDAKGKNILDLIPKSSDELSKQITALLKEQNKSENILWLSHSSSSKEKILPNHEQERKGSINPDK